MLDEKDLQQEILDSLSDDLVPNNPNRIKALYADREKFRNKPWYKYSRIYAVGAPILAATIAVAIVAPILLTRETKTINNVITPKYEYSNLKIESSENQIAMAVKILGNAVNSMSYDGILPSESLKNSSFKVIKDIYALNSYMYTIETMIDSTYEPTYTTIPDDVETNLLTTSFNNSSVSATYTYNGKGTYNGEQFYTLEGTLSPKDGVEYDIEGSKNGLIGFYESNVILYLNVEHTKGFNVHFENDLMGDQILYVEEFIDREILSKTELHFVTRRLGDKVDYYVEAVIDETSFSVYPLSNGNFDISISETDYLTANKVSVDGVDYYEYINQELGLDFKLKRR